MSSPLPPWHMWGSTDTISVVPGVRTPPKQLARVNYARPESWGFFFAAKIVGAPFDPVERTVYVNFDLMLGVGRGVIDTAQSASTLDSFCQMQLYLAGGADVSSAVHAYTSVVPKVLIQGPVVPAPPVMEVSAVVAQDIQCGVSGFLGGGSVGPMVVEVAAFFAPLSHVRPEWFQNEFPGHEQHGK